MISNTHPLGVSPTRANSAKESSLRSREGGTAHQPERDVEVGDKVVEDVADALFAVEREAVDVGTADQDGARTEAERLHDVGPAADAAVHEHGHVGRDGPDDARQRIEGGDRSRRPGDRRGWTR